VTIAAAETDGKPNKEKSPALRSGDFSFPVNNRKSVCHKEHKGYQEGYRFFFESYVFFVAIIFRLFSQRVWNTENLPTWRAQWLDEREKDKMKQSALLFRLLGCGQDLLGNHGRWKLLRAGPPIQN
jgi:hypothetical protein